MRTFLYSPTYHTHTHTTYHASPINQWLTKLKIIREFYWLDIIFYPMKLPCTHVKLIYHPIEMGKTGENSVTAHQIEYIKTESAVTQQAEK